MGGGRGEVSVYFYLALDCHEIEVMLLVFLLSSSVSSQFDLFVLALGCPFLISWGIFSIPGNEVHSCGEWSS